MSRIVNLGSACIDHVYQVDHFAAAGETLLANGYQRFPGGKGLNQSLAAARAGAEVCHAGRIGSDGDLLRDVLIAAGVDVRQLITDATQPSGHACIQVRPDGANCIVIVGGANRAIDAAQREAVLGAMADDDWLLLQNEINDLAVVLRRAAQLGRRVALNVAPADAAARELPLDDVEVLIVNRVEAAVLSGEQPPERALQALSARLPRTLVVLTLGADGLHWGRREERGYLPAFDVHAVDETAAGDAFVGYLLAGLAADETLDITLRRASAAGALAVTVPGAASSIPEAAAVSALLEA